MIPGLFLGFAALFVLSSLLVVLHRNPVTSALFLVMAFCSLAGIYILLGAEFIGMVQVIVYAGAIMVLFLFVIMYLNLGRDREGSTASRVRRALGWVIGAIVVAEGIFLFAHRWVMGPQSPAPPAPGIGNTQALGQVLYSRYLFPFEITSLVLLVAMVGAIVISRGRGRTTEAEGPAPAAGLRGMLKPGDSISPPPGGTP